MLDLIGVSTTDSDFDNMKRVWTTLFEGSITDCDESYVKDVVSRIITRPISQYEVVKALEFARKLRETISGLIDAVESELSKIENIMGDTESLIHSRMVLRDDYKTFSNKVNYTILTLETMNDIFGYRKTHPVD